MGTKNSYENGPNPFFLFGNKNMVRPTLMGTKNLYETGLNPFFYSELYSSSTTSPVKRCRHQLMLRFYSCSNIVGG